MTYTTPGTRLVHRDGHVVEVGERVPDFRGEPLTVLGWRIGSHEGSTGRVLVKDPLASFGEREYFPGVIECTVEEVE